LFVGASSFIWPIEIEGDVVSLLSSSSVWATKKKGERKIQISEFLAEVRELVGRNTCSVAGSARVEEMSLSIAGLSSSWCQVTDQG
jgi:hypothetical protein